MRRLLAIAVALVTITLAVYWQVGDHEFVGLDDNLFITENVHVATGLTIDNVVWAFTPVPDLGWFPVTWLSHMVDVELYGLDPRGHHLTNVAFHVLATLFLFLLLFRTTKALVQSAFVAALFALHPLHVESVAWVAERRDVLSACFGFLSLWLYTEYVMQQQRGFYLLALLAFVLGLMSKPMLVTLPLIMLLIDCWPLNRYGLTPEMLGQQTMLSRIVKEKVPFIAFSLVSALITLNVPLSNGTFQSFDEIPFKARIANALTAYIKYLIKMFLPTDLAVYYPFPSTIPLWQTLCSLLSLLAITAIAIWVGRRYPYVIVGWFWYLIALVPVLGIIQFATHSIADRYTYFPLTGLFIIVAWGVSPLTKKLPFVRSIIAVLAISIVTTATVLTWRQLKIWQNSMALFEHSLRVAPGSALIHASLGIEYYDKGYIDEAIEEYHKAMTINPRYYIAYNSLGLALAEKGLLDEAIAEYQKAINIKPNYSDAYNNLGLALAGKGRIDDALESYRKALDIDPRNFKVYNNIGVVLGNKGLYDEAVQQYLKAIEINRNDYMVYNNFGAALYEIGRVDEAILKYKKAIEINPNYINARYNLGLAYAHQGRFAEAISEFKEIVKINPNDAMAREQLMRALERR